MIRQRASPEWPIKVEARIQIEDYFDRVIRPRQAAPVLVADGDTTVLQAMEFSLIPSWSKDGKVKFATHNARLETLAEKPTWRGPFKSRHCLVPMSDFIEPIYDGAEAGFMVAFHHVHSQWLFAAGIWDQWTDRTSGEVTESFAIVTTTPPEFVARTGHDRCPVFVRESSWSSWLKVKDVSPQHMTQVLVEGQPQVEFALSRHRAMKPGWEKRK